MLDLTLKEIIDITQGSTAATNTNVIINNISTDTRSLESGDVFLALKGDNFNGEDYIAVALKKGATAVITENQRDFPKDKIILVENTRHAMLAISGLYRRKFNTVVIGITGSVGKTSTKEMIAAILEDQGKTLKTKANLNNEVGLSQMLFLLDSSYKYAVLELGVDGKDQMKPMAKALDATSAVVTNIGISHLKHFGSIDNIEKEKLTIKEGLIPEGTLILNGDDNRLNKVKYSGKTLLYGIENKESQLLASNIKTMSTNTTYTLMYNNNAYLVELPTVGRHNVLNSLCALAVAVVLRIDINQAIASLKKYKSYGMRQKLVNHNGYTIVEDCYNANPQSMRAAMETLGEMEVSGRRIAVLADMLETGENEQHLHTQLGKTVAENQVDMLLTTGNLSVFTHQGGKENGVKESLHFSDKAQLSNYLIENLKEGDVVWVKGSRGMHLEEVLDAIYKEEE